MIRRLISSWFRAAACSIALLVAAPAYAQNPIASPIQASQVVFPIQTPLAPIRSASVSLVGNPGPATYYYWIVANYTLGSASPSTYFIAINAPNNLSASNYINIAPTLPPNVMSFDVLRTTSPVPPFGSCNCAVATAVTTGSAQDQSNSLNAYNVAATDPNAFNLSLANEIQGGGSTHLILRQAR